jgi:mannose-6-phosphate isomerase
VAESWEIAAHPNGASVVRNGALAGTTLSDVLGKWADALVGTRNLAALAQGRFPLLIKLLDANRWLSVQVHPDDAYGLAHAGEFGKTEMWVVLHAEPGSEIIYGFTPGVDREAFAQAIADGETEHLLHRLAVQEGDVIFVPAGAVHALGPGVIAAEIQQNSDTTYRIYDWGRARPLHTEQAMAVLDFDLVAPTAVTPVPVADSPATELIGECAYFRTERLRMAVDETIAGACDGSTFEIWGVLRGAVRVDWAGESISLRAVDWVLLPAALGHFSITATADCELLRVITPELEDADRV